MPTKGHPAGGYSHNPKVADEAAMPRGCVCPPGAEATCRGISCPRNPPMGQKFINGQLVWSR